MPDAPPKPRSSSRARRKRITARRETAERKFRIIEDLTAGLSVIRIARKEKLSVQRVRALVRETLERREMDPPAGFVQLQIARINQAMVVAHLMMEDGNLQALDRFVRLTGELDRYHGLLANRREALAAPAEPPRELPPPTSAEEPAAKLFPLATP